MNNKTRIKQLFSKVSFLILDVDGVLTKGEIIYDNEGRELKIFNVKDGLGIFLLSQAGIPTIIITAKDGCVVRRRAKDMRIAEVYGGVLPKEKLLPAIIKKYKVKPQNICFVGDDVIDIGLMRKVGLAVAVSDAPGIVKKSAGYITRKKGGEGAVREIADLIIDSKGLGKNIDDFIKNIGKK